MFVNVLQKTRRNNAMMGGAYFNLVALRPLCWVVFSLCVLLCSPGRAEWSQARGDATRQAHAVDVEAMSDAQVSWRFFVGGSLSATNHLLIPAPLPEVAPHIVMVAANRAVRKRIDDVLLWQSEGFSVTRFVGLFDMDGDDSLELVALGRFASGVPAAFLLNPENGSLLWSSTEGDVGQLRDTARVVDMTGDGLPDLYLADAGTNLPGSVPYGVHLYSFAEGADAGQKEWSMSMSPGRDYFVSLMDAVGDFDGDGSMDVFVQGLKKVYVYSGQDGSLMGASDVVGNTAAGRSEVVLADLDGDGDQEILTFAPGGWSLSINAVRVALFDWDQESKTPVLRWERSAENLETDAIAFHTSSLANVDTDEALEVVVSFFEGQPGQWKTEVRDALTGTLEASIEGKRMDSTLDVDGDGVHEIFFHDDETPLEVFKVLEGSIVPFAQAPDLLVLKCLKRSTSYAQAITTTPCAKVDSISGELQVVVGTYDQERQVKDLRKMVFKEGEAVEKSAFKPSSNVRFKTFDALFPLHPTAEWMGVLSSGRLLQFDGGLNPLNYAPDAEQPILGLKIPSYDPGFGDLSRFPIAIDLEGDGAAEIGAVTSDARAVLANVKEATMAGHTVSVFSHEEATAIVSGRGLAGDARVVVIGSENLTCLNSEGDVLWTTKAFDPQSQLKRYGDVITMDLDSDGASEVITQTRDSTNGEQSLLAWSIEDGTVYFKTLIDQNNSGMRRLAGGWLEGAEAPPHLLGGLPSALWSLNSETGEPATLAQLKLGVHEVVVDVNQDGKDDVLAVNRQSLELVDASGELVWSMDTELLKPNLGSVSSCDDSLFYLSASSRGTRLWRRALANGQLADEVTLAGGLVFDSDEDAQVAGLLPASLGNTLSFTTTTGEQGVAVGSQDGFLYVLNPCDLSLTFAVAIDAPLREIIAADWDGDGSKELVVSAADGYVYGVDRKEMEGPSFVLDTDPPRGITEEDVDDIETHNALYATWAPVEGATSYHVGIFTNDGQSILADTMDLGTATEGTFDLLTLQLGQRYIVSVEAEGPGGVSASILSNGVTVVDVSDPTASLQGDVDALERGIGVVNLSYEAADKTGVEHVSLTLKALGGEGQVTLFELIGVHQGQLEGKVTWTPPMDWPLGATMARFEVIDGAGHKAVALAELQVVSATESESDPELSDDPDVSSDSGSSPDADGGDAMESSSQSGTNVGSGCACRAGSEVPDLSGLILVFFWFMMRRRKVSMENAY
jgi:hypothetical protein